MLRAAPFLAVLPLIAACRTEPRDTGCVGCFEPTQMLWNLSMGLEAGTFTDVVTQEGVRSPLLHLVIANEDYPATWDDADACLMDYRIEGSPGTLDPEAWQDWALELTPLATDCQDLPPARWGDPPLDRFAGRAWEVSLEERTDDMEKYLQQLFSANGTDWTHDGAPYYFGSHTWLDAWDTSGDYGQTHYARAWQVDADMAVVDEDQGGHLLSVGDVAAGSDGYYEIFSIYFFAL